MKMITKTYPSCDSIVVEKLIQLGFTANSNRIGKDRNFCCVLSHDNGIDCEIPYRILECYPEIEQKVNAVLGFYIESCCKHKK